MPQVHQLTASQTALKRQAEQVAAAYTMQLSEVEELKAAAGTKAGVKAGVAAGGRGDAAGSVAGEGSEVLDADAIEAAAQAAAAATRASPKAAAAAGEGEGESETELKAENARLRSTLGQVREEGTKAAASAEAMKRQAESLSREYARVMAQKESLENKLADFELILGDTVKKAK